jgi:hypothetical protein
VTAPRLAPAPEAPAETPPEEDEEPPVGAG